MHFKKCLLAAGFAAALIGGAIAAPYPRATTPSAIDMGAVQNVAGENQATVTVALKLRNADQLNSLVDATYKAGNASYRHFLTTNEFADRFAPSAATIAQVTRHFQAAGFSVAQSATAHLQVTGSLAAIQREFGVQIHQYEVPATSDTPSYRFRAPLAAPQLSAAIADSVDSVFGLDTRARMRPHIMVAGPRHALRSQVPLKKGTIPNTPDAPGVWTVVDFAQYYNVEPLYQHGINGRKQTVGIMTFASFTPSDAFAYWTSVGLAVSPNRLKVVKVDGGSGPPSDASGSDETSLDVEQSGGLAPGANIIVYEAPNTDQGFVDVFAAAIDKNAADTLSISWGEWEFLDTYSATNPNTGKTTTALRAINSLLAQAALQGESVFAAAGDDGAYDANDGNFFPLPEFTKTLSVDDPGAQPFITAAGGTTLPGPQEFLLPSGATYTVTINYEQAWGWDYLIPLCNKLGFDPVSCGIFPGGGGGGVSIEWPLPSYQFGVPGVQLSQPGQVLIDTTPKPPQVIAKLPAFFPGRNVPDISVNSDPDTGYTIYYTSDVSGFEIETFIGGTSFAAPQMNGVTSLLDQGLGRRVGLLNYPLYNLVRSGQAYGGRNPPLRDIVHGDIWFYQGRPGYDQATGVGVPNVANLLQALESPLY